MKLNTLELDTVPLQVMHACDRAVQRVLSMWLYGTFQFIRKHEHTPATHSLSQYGRNIRLAGEQR